MDTARRSSTERKYKGIMRDVLQRKFLLHWNTSHYVWNINWMIHHDTNTSYQTSHKPHYNQSIHILTMTEITDTTLLDSFLMTSARLILFIPMWSKIATTMAIMNPNTHNTTPTQQMKTLCTAWEQKYSNGDVRDIPPHSVHCIPYLSSKLWVIKKFRTEPRREQPTVRPKANDSSLSLNQRAVMQCCTTERDEKDNVPISGGRALHKEVSQAYQSEMRCLLQKRVVQWALAAADRGFLWSGSPVRRARSQKHTAKRTKMPPLHKNSPNWSSLIGRAFGSHSRFVHNNSKRLTTISKPIDKKSCKDHHYCTSVEKKT